MRVKTDAMKEPYGQARLPRFVGPPSYLSVMSVARDSLSPAAAPSATQLLLDDAIPPSERQARELREMTFVIVDLETTGGSAEVCDITEIGAVKVRGGEVLGEFATLVRPPTS